MKLTRHKLRATIQVSAEMLTDDMFMATVPSMLARQLIERFNSNPKKGMRLDSFNLDYKIGPTGYVFAPMDIATIYLNVYCYIPSRPLWLQILFFWKSDEWKQNID